MLDRLLDVADPYIAEAIVGVASTYMGFLFRSVFKTKESQASLHRAIATGVDYVTDHLAASISQHSTFVTSLDRLPPEVSDALVGYIKGSVPGAVAYLKADDHQLNRMARAAINARMLQLLKKN